MGEKISVEAEIEKIGEIKTVSQLSKGNGTIVAAGVVGAAVLAGVGYAVGKIFSAPHINKIAAERNGRAIGNQASFAQTVINNRQNQGVQAGM